MGDFKLTFTGSTATGAEIDFYDVSRALIGFQRSLALTVHLAVNGEIITQAPALKNAQIRAAPPREGSWEIIATVAAALGGAAVAPKDSVLGHFTRSLYDYVLKATLGIDVDFEKTIRTQHEELVAAKKITEEKLDSLIEKTEAAVIDMHRPIVFSETARRARIRFGREGEKLVGPTLTPETYEHATRTVEVKRPDEFEGIISSYNSNTYKGRIYLLEEKRPVPFELAPGTQDRSSVQLITNSLSVNAVDRANTASELAIKAFRRESSVGRLKSLYVVHVAPTWHGAS